MKTISILHVDGDRSFSESFSAALFEESDRFSIRSEQRVSDAVDHLTDSRERIDCIVSEYDLPETTGLDFLSAVRDEHPELPFILFTGTERDSIASEAISEGVTDYVRKGDDEQYTLLANRLEGFVEQYRSRSRRDQVYHALEAATEGIGLLDERGRYVYLNDAYAELYDYDRDDLVGTHWERLYPEDEADRFHEEILPILERDGTWSGHSLGKRATGETFSEELSLTKLSTDGHVCVVRDVSRRLERERQFETLATTLQGMVYRCRNEPSWPMETVHGNIEEFLGYTAAGLASQQPSWGELIHPDDRETVWRSIQDALAASERFELTYRVIDSDGDIKWVIERGCGVYDQNGSVEAVEGLVTDITDRKRREEELEWKTQAIDEAPLGIVMSDPNQGDNPITYVNDRFSELTGYSKDEVRGRNCRFLQGPLTDEEPIQQIRDAIATEESIGVDLLNYRKEKIPFWNHVQITPITDDDGTLTHFVGFQNDITSRVEHERRIEILNRMLLHNIRNNLNILLGYLSILAERLPTETELIADVRAPIDRLIESSEKARQIESRLESASFQPERLNLEQLLEKALAHGWEIDGNAEIRSDVDPDCCVLASESVAVALRELIENAVKYTTEAQPTVTITTDTKTVDFPQQDETRDAVVIHIDDTNTTISDLDRTRLLGNEESAVHHGSGLGLWIVHWIVTMSGGLITHTPREPRGNRISVTLLRPE
ncbi:PAS domain S-box protein [Halobacteria archaeon AArc-m2/3/4]|uniref:histidine kinase n=1 Tax=Natronoglomus mannanivorans TaxID=2979990 RepID=A0ABT2QKD9_9EURY|nr:PAS domain S-box protein [Halobacteria archaeon AArc-m2/3/4]